MKRTWEMFENMNEYVYVSDVDRHEIVYMNRKLREAVGVSEDGYQGQKCHQILQKSQEPCAICNASALKAGDFKEWSYYNPVFDKYLLVKDTMIEEDGRCYRVEIDIDISQIERRGERFKSKENLEASVHAGVKLAMQATSPEKSIEILLEYLGKALKGERTYVFERNKEGGDDNTYEWVADGVTAEKENLQNLPAEVCAHWYRDFHVDKTITINDLEDIRLEDPLQYENLKRQNIHSLVVVPLYDDGRAIGFYGVDNPPQNSLDYATNMLQIMGYFIISLIRRREMIRRLEHISFSDQLTNLGNRYAMKEYMTKIEPTASIGVVYCDITGLKKVNDTQGHQKGDDLIVRAAGCLQRIFGSYGLFRIGGDEMLVLCEGIRRQDLDESVEQLKSDTAAHDVVLAIGSAWSDGEDAGVEKLLTVAEAEMYKNKSEYYAKIGVDRRTR